MTESVDLRVRDERALNLASSVGLIPQEVVDTRTSLKGRLPLGIDILDSHTITRTLLDFILPVIVDRASTGIILIAHAIRKLDIFAVHNTSTIEPIHMLTAQTGSKIILLSCIFDS